MQIGGDAKLGLMPLGLKLDLMSWKRKGAKTLSFIILLTTASNEPVVFGERDKRFRNACALTGAESIVEQDIILDAAFSSGDLLEAFRCGQLLSSLAGSEGPSHTPMSSSHSP